MRKGLLLCVCLGGALALTLCPTPARADDGGTPRGVVPLRAPPAPRHVPVPDVRGMAEADAQRALTEGGLGIGGIERVSVERLEAELGRRYVPGVVVQQAPRPSTGDQPSWLRRGSFVWLRVAWRGERGVVRPQAPVVPTQPRDPFRRPDAPLGKMQRYTGRTPVPPPPAIGPAVVQRPVVQRPVVQPPVVQPPIVQPPVVQPPVVQPPVVQPPLDQALPFAEPQAPDTFVAADIRSNVALPCERRQERWHLRPVGGAALWVGDDKSSVDLYAGIDVGRTFSSCFGVDVFYRYASGTFDRDVPGGLLEDAGTFQNIGLKGTYNASLGTDGHLFVWAGLGVTYFWSNGLQVDDTGVAGFVELGLGYAISEAIRVRLGVNVHALDTDAGRFLPANDTTTRLLWIVAPTLGVELDL